MWRVFCFLWFEALFGAALDMIMCVRFFYDMEKCITFVARKKRGARGCHAARVIVEPNTVDFGLRSSFM